MAGLVALTASGVLLAGFAPAQAAAAPVFTPGAAGIGDSYFPLEGNGGYDVDHYRVQVSWAPATNVVTGVTTVDAHVTQNLSRFNLDLQGMTVDAVVVNGKTASFSHPGGELVITPVDGLVKASAMRVVVRYHGVPKPRIIQPFGAKIGWLRTNDGAAVAAQPDAASTWFPSNDHPSDKASFTFVVTAPSAYTSVANGLPSGSSTAGGLTTTTWQAPDPMATYLATVALGKFRVHRYTTPGGIPVLDAISVGVGKDADNAVAALPRILDYEQSVFGKYPFSSAGNTVVDAFLGFALETQTRPIYDRGFFAPGNQSFELGVVVHEYAHMWFGDSVAVRDWSDIWLNEGFATYAEWLWSGHVGEGTPEQIYQGLICAPADATFLWNPPPGAPGRSQMFAQSVYVRGAMTLHALRKAIGDQAFFTVLRRWAATNKDGLGTTERFIGLAQGVSGKKLQPLFDEWLYTAGKPASLPRTCPAAGAAARTALADRFSRPAVLHP